MTKENGHNLFTRLREGVFVSNLTALDCEVVNELYQTGNELLTLYSEDADVQKEIDENVPFDAEFKYDAKRGEAYVVICLDAHPSGETGSPFPLPDSVCVKWV